MNAKRKQHSISLDFRLASTCLSELQQKQTAEIFYEDNGTGEGKNKYNIHFSRFEKDWWYAAAPVEKFEFNV